MGLECLLSLSLFRCSLASVAVSPCHVIFGCCSETRIPSYLWCGLPASTVVVHGWMPVFAACRVAWVLKRLVSFPVPGIVGFSVFARQRHHMFAWVGF